METDEEEASLLVIVLDADPRSWRDMHVNGNGANGGGKPKSLTTLPKVLDTLLVFIDSYLLTHRGNRVCVVAAMAGESDFLFPDLAGERKEAEGQGVRAEGALVDKVAHSIVEGLKRMQKEEAEREKQPADAAAIRGAGGSQIVQAFSKGLCYTQRVLRETSVQPRVLILQASEDAHGSYNGMMNCIFSAHRSSIPVDACVLGPTDSSFLQQASFITGGIYSRPERPDALLEYFLYLFLPSSKTRQYLRLPKQESVDFRAACFCHRMAVEMAYVCSVCLSIYCETSAECPTCGTPARKGNRALSRQPSEVR